MTRTLMVASLVLTALVALPVTPATSQADGERREAAPPVGATVRGFGVQPGMPFGQQGAVEHQASPRGVSSLHNPAFLSPFHIVVPLEGPSAARIGLSGWTTSAAPLDATAGGVALGFSLVWPVSIPDPMPRPTR